MIIPAKLYGVALAQVYGIFDADTNEPAFDYDTFVDFKLHANVKVSDFPVEQGAFATYNKVNRPNTVKVKLAVTDMPTRRHAFLIALDAVLKSTRLFNVVTQDATYLNVTLEDYSYARTKIGGWGKVVAELAFLEVRQVTRQYASVKNPGAQGPKSNGLVTPATSDYAWAVLGAATLGKVTTGVLGAVMAPITGAQAIKALSPGSPAPAVGTPATAFSASASPTTSLAVR